MGVGVVEEHAAGGTAEVEPVSPEVEPSTVEGEKADLMHL